MSHTADMAQNPSTNLSNFDTFNHHGPDKRFNWKNLIIAFSISDYLFTNYLSVRQYRVLCKSEPPKVLEGKIDKETFDKSNEYGRAKARVGFAESFYSLGLNLSIIHYNVLPKVYDIATRVIQRWAPSYLHGSIPTSVVFFFIFQWIGELFGMPFAVYRTFVLEEKFGFNKQTPKLFVTDLLKSQALSIAIGSPLLAAALKIIDYFGDRFFFYIWVFMFVFQLVAMTVYPTLIQPLFNKLTPLEDGELKTSVENLAASVKFPLTKLYVIDGSKRSSHSNAYFFGMPWSKRIVIYDTLIEKSTTQEVTAVLAHEIGHWSRSHISKMLVFMEGFLFSIFVMFSAFIKNKSLYNSFGFYNQMPILVGWVLFSDIMTPIGTVVGLFSNVMSRKFEYEADEYAYKLGYSKDLAKALVGLHVENLSNVDADSWYSAYHYSHPLLPERLNALKTHEQKEK